MTSGPVVHFQIPGRPLGGVKVYHPGAGKRSYRVVWTEAPHAVRERTRTNRELAIELAESIAVDLASEMTPTRSADPVFAELVHYHLYGPGKSKRLTSPKSERRPITIARRILTDEHLSLPASHYTGIDGSRALQQILNRASTMGVAKGGWEYEKAGELLRTVLRVAARDGLIELPHGNPMDNLKFRRHHFTIGHGRGLRTVDHVGPEARPPTQRVHEFIDAANTMFGSREARYIEVLAFGGLRPGEANGLTVGQLGEHAGLYIDRQLMELTPAEAERDGGPTIQVRLPKWQMKRNAFYPSVYLNKLRTLAEEESLGPTDFLFPTARGGPRRQNNWRRDVFKPVAAHVNWPTTAVHVRGRLEQHFLWPAYSFRHHYANHLLKDLGIPLVNVAMFMGHRDSRVTELMYLKDESADLVAADAAYERLLTGEATP